MKTLFILMLAFFLSQQLKANISLPVDSSKDYSIRLASSDLKKGQIKFLILGGIVASHLKGQEIFEKKYGIKYYDFGCVMPSNISIADYNKIVTLHMDRKYGRAWRQMVRRDVQGI